MKYPKYRLAFPGKHIWVFNGHPMTQFNGYNLTTTAIGNGLVSADKTKGYYGESATLYVSAGPDYEFSGMEVDVGTLDNNTYVFGRGDATLSAYFEMIYDPLNPLSLPPYTIRFKCNSQPHIFGGSLRHATEIGNDVWDFTYSSNNWDDLFVPEYTARDHDNTMVSAKVTRVVGMNSKGVTSMSGMFMGQAYNKGIDTIFNTETLIDPNSMFAYNYSITSTPSSLYFPVARDVMFMFHGMGNVNDFTLIIPQASSIRDTFKNSKANKITVSGNNIKYMWEAFEGSSAKEINISDASKVENMAWAFRNCENLSAINFGSLPSNKLTNMTRTFDYCIKLKELPLFDTSKVTEVGGAFSQCYSLTSIPNYNLESTNSIGYICNGCSSLQTIPNFTYMPPNKVPTQYGVKEFHCEYAFNNCLNVNSNIYNTYTAISSRMNNDSVTIGNLQDMCFKNCGVSSRTGSAELAQIPSEWK